MAHIPGSQLVLFSSSAFLHSAEKECCLPFQFYKDQAFSHFMHCTLRGIQDGEKQETFSVLWILAQDREDAYLRDHLRNPDSSIFHTQKSINIINLRGLFSISSNLLMFSYMGLFGFCWFFSIFSCMSWLLPYRVAPQS